VGLAPGHGADAAVPAAGVSQGRDAGVVARPLARGWRRLSPLLAPVCGQEQIRERERNALFSFFLRQDKNGLCSMRRKNHSSKTCRLLRFILQEKQH